VFPKDIRKSQPLTSCIVDLISLPHLLWERAYVFAAELSSQQQQQQQQSLLLKPGLAIFFERGGFCLGKE
jgi:hypothetical protein